MMSFIFRLVVAVAVTTGFIFLFYRVIAAHFLPVVVVVAAIVAVTYCQQC